MCELEKTDVVLLNQGRARLWRNHTIIARKETGAFNAFPSSFAPDSRLAKGLRSSRISYSTWKGIVLQGICQEQDDSVEVLPSYVIHLCFLSVTLRRGMNPHGFFCLSSVRDGLRDRKSVV